ncbi:MAG: hypothetical protein ACREVM_01210, partial [Burkholderiales bacterium]
MSEDMGRDALRVLAVACKELPAGGPYAEEAVEKEMTCLGLVGIRRSGECTHSDFHDVRVDRTDP